jgi:hypothetical protein
MKHIFLSAIALLVSAFAAPAFAQVTGPVSGTVTDDSGKFEITVLIPPYA